MNIYWNREITLYLAPDGQLLFGTRRRYGYPFHTAGRYRGWGLWTGRSFIGVMVRTRELASDEKLRAMMIKDCDTP